MILVLLHVVPGKRRVWKENIENGFRYHVRLNFWKQNNKKEIMLASWKKGHQDTLDIMFPYNKEKKSWKLLYCIKKKNSMEIY